MARAALRVRVLVDEKDLVAVAVAVVVEVELGRLVPESIAQRGPAKADVHSHDVHLQGRNNSKDQSLSVIDSNVKNTERQILSRLGFSTIMYPQVKYTLKPNVKYSFARYYNASFNFF